MAGVYGLSGSGMDVDALVASLMKAQRVKYDTMQQKKTQLEWKKTDYNTMYTSINDFRNNTVFNYKLQNTLMPKQVTSSNESVATVTANADASNVNHSLTVSQLASGVAKTSNASITATGRTKDTLANQFGLSDSFNFQINGKAITVDKNQSINTLVSTINNSGAGVKANYDATMDRFFMYSNDTGSAAGIDFSNSSNAGLSFLTNNLKLNTLPTMGTTATTSTADTGFGAVTTATLSDLGYSNSFTLKIKNGTDTANIAIDTTTDTMDTLLNKINTATDSTTGKSVNAVASYDTATGKFSLKSSSGTLDLSGSDSAALGFLTNQLRLPPKTQGTDAKFNLDGTDLTQTSNSFTISGAKYNLKGIGTTNANVVADTTTTIANVKKFIETYNSTLSKITAELEETKYKDYLPLTSEQKTDMKEADITTWETKAKSGTLYRNPILQTAITQMRSDISTPISGLTGDYKNASSIGISTGTYLEGGKLYLDETKLAAALAKDPEIVNKIFGTTNTDNTHAQNGIAVRLYDSLKTASDKIVAEAGATVSTTSDIKSSVAKQILAYTKNMTELNTRLAAIEANYYKKFNAMETALAKLNKQSSWLSSQSTSTTG